MGWVDLVTSYISGVNNDQAYTNPVYTRFYLFKKN